MGFEITFSYREEIEKGLFDEEVKTRKVRLGKPEDNLGLEAAAAKIFAQFARRNILVTDVEIYEYTKKKLSFKEVDDGIVIRNKKFKYDDGPIPVGDFTSDESEVEKALEFIKQNPQILEKLKPTSNSSSVPKINGTIIRHEVYDPDPELLKLARQRGLKFTPKKKYPIYSERMGATANEGMIYTTIKDNNEQQNISDRYFIGPQTTLYGEGQFVEDSQKILGDSGQDASLVYDGVVEDNMPNLRG